MINEKNAHKQHVTQIFLVSLTNFISSSLYPFERIGALCENRLKAYCKIVTSSRNVFWTLNHKRCTKSITYLSIKYFTCWWFSRQYLNIQKKHLKNSWSETRKPVSPHISSQVGFVIWIKPREFATQVLPLQQHQHH